MKIYILSMYLLNAIFSKSTIQKILYYPNNNYREHENDIIIYTDYEIERVKMVFQYNKYLSIL